MRRNHSINQPVERRFRYDGKQHLTHLTDESRATPHVFYDGNDQITKVVRLEQYDVGQDNGQGICYAYDCHDHAVGITGLHGAVLQE